MISQEPVCLRLWLFPWRLELSEQKSNVQYEADNNIIQSMTFSNEKELHFLLVQIQH